MDIPQPPACRLQASGPQKVTMAKPRTRRKSRKKESQNRPATARAVQAASTRRARKSAKNAGGKNGYSGTAASDDPSDRGDAYEEQGDVVKGAKNRTGCGSIRIGTPRARAGEPP
jgi:hypothetical protein